MKSIGYKSRFEKILYVSDLPGHGGVDWGYDSNVSKAIHLSPYWQRRFRKDTERVGEIARFLDMADEHAIFTAKDGSTICCIKDASIGNLFIKK